MFVFLKITEISVDFLVAIQDRQIIFNELPIFNLLGPWSVRHATNMYI